MDFNKLIQELKSTQNLHYQATLNLIQDHRKKQNEDVKSLIQNLSTDLEGFNKSLDEIIEWYEQERHNLFKKACDKLYSLEFSAQPLNNHSATLVEEIKKNG